MNAARQEPYTHAEMAEYLKLAASYYNIFSRLFEQEFTAELWENFKLNAASFPPFGGEGSVVSRLPEAVSYYGQFEPEQQLIELASLYARQFLTMGGKIFVSLAQSVYTSPKHMLCQDSFFAARGAYFSQGLELAEEVDLTDDNLAVMLRFMAHHAELVSGISAGADLADALKRQDEFRQLLILSWLDALVQRAKDFSEDSIYTLLLEYLREFVLYDKEESAAMLASL